MLRDTLYPLVYVCRHTHTHTHARIHMLGRSVRLGYHFTHTEAHFWREERHERRAPCAAFSCGIERGKLHMTQLWRVYWCYRVQGACIHTCPLISICTHKHREAYSSEQPPLQQTRTVIRTSRKAAAAAQELSFLSTSYSRPSLASGAAATA